VGPRHGKPQANGLNSKRDVAGVPGCDASAAQFIDGLSSLAFSGGATPLRFPESGTLDLLR
jgi:hypothetical protein